MAENKGKTDKADEKDVSQMSEAEQMQYNYDRQQEVAARKPVPHRPDVGTEQGFTNATAEQQAHNERHGVEAPKAGDQAGSNTEAPVSGTAGGTSTAARRTVK